MTTGIGFLGASFHLGYKPWLGTCGGATREGATGSLTRSLRRARSARLLPAPAPARARPCTVCATSQDETTSETESTYTETTLIAETEALNPETGSTILEASYALPGTFVAAAVLGRFAELPVLWVPCALIGVLLTVQAANVRFVFGPTRLSVTRRTGDELKIIRGWRYDQFKHWELWWEFFPVLAYFRENESYGGRGSIHFFPVVCDGKVLREMLAEKCARNE